MCKWGTWQLVYVKIDAGLSATGEETWKWAKVDACIADIVDALQVGGIDMLGSCCGHGDLGHIALVDGRVLVITDCSYYREVKWAVQVLIRVLRLKLRYLIYRIVDRNIY